jgi:hypothetical protein
MAGRYDSRLEINVRSWTSVLNHGLKLEYPRHGPRSSSWLQAESCSVAGACAAPGPSRPGRRRAACQWARASTAAVSESDIDTGLGPGLESAPSPGACSKQSLRRRSTLVLTVGPPESGWRGQHRHCSLARPSLRPGACWPRLPVRRPRHCRQTGRAADSDARAGRLRRSRSEGAGARRHGIAPGPCDSEASMNSEAGPAGPGGPARPLPPSGILYTWTA